MIFHYTGARRGQEPPYGAWKCSLREVIWAVGFDPFTLDILWAVLKKETGSTAITSVSWKLIPCMREEWSIW